MTDLLHHTMSLALAWQDVQTLPWSMIITLIVFLWIIYALYQ